MEIINTVLTNLTTENEILTNILLIPCGFLEILFSMLLFTQLLNITASKKSKVLYFILVSLWSNIINFIIPRPYVVYLNILICPIAIFLVFKTSIIKSVLGEIIPLVIIALLETIIIKFYTSILNITYDKIIYVPIHRLLPVLLICLILFLLYLFFKKFKFNIHIFDNFDKKIKSVLLIDFIFGILAIGLQFYISAFYMNHLPSYITMFSILTLISYFLISMYALAKVTKLENTKISLEESQLYNKTLQILHDNVRAFRHDFSNIIAGIGGYVETEDMNGLKNYYSQLLVDCQCTNNLTTLSPNLINNPAIYNVLATKYHIADERGIKIELSIFYNFNNLNIKIYELTRILGILLDNAIEAASECDKKFINLIIRDEPNHNRQVILIENTYANKNVDTEQIYNKGYSTKSGNTGLGLWEIRQILKKNNNLNLFTSKNDEYFTQSLEIYNL